MKKLTPFIISLAMVFIISSLIGIANANLTDLGNGLIYCDTLDITLLQDANYSATSGYWDLLNIPIEYNIYGEQVNYPGDMNWDQSMQWANQLVFAGYDDWRLPDGLCAGNYPETGYAQSPFNELGHIFYNELGNPTGGPLQNTGPFINLMPEHYWTGLLGIPFNNVALSFYFKNSIMNYTGRESDIRAWAVRDGYALNAVPEPSTIILLLSGVVGLAGLRKRFKK